MDQTKFTVEQVNKILDAARHLFQTECIMKGTDVREARLWLEEVGGGVKLLITNRDNTKGDSIQLSNKYLEK